MIVINAQDTLTALHRACENRQHEIISLLIKHGADVESQTQVSPRCFLMSFF